MKKPYILLIETSEPTQSAEVIDALHQSLAKNNRTVYTAHLPSDGPLGHLLRVADQDRVTFDFFAGAALSVIDSMDYFFNPATGITKNNQEADLILIEGYLAKIFTRINHDQAKMNWFSSICKILPAPQMIVCVSGEQNLTDFLKSIWNHTQMMSPEEFYNCGLGLVSAWWEENP